MLIKLKNNNYNIKIYIITNSAVLITDDKSQTMNVSHKDTYISNKL